ncbi:adenylate/guanylate cyclase domain-containing protein [Gracilinema caldarium]|uniref:adenylate/guanylate cyclase domain-containing protein n=1 Tax=Gracilinema caldarium TaxID=215591 RepID=UPI000302073B|nr:adenylate/guanylate cyclase domain-containing protein [Gracilinema caldarium]
MISTILFIDIKGSTRLYSDLGDAKAVGLVREHFRILFKYIEKYNGLPVKTIGDAVMGFLIDSRHTIQVAIEAQQALREYYLTWNYGYYGSRYSGCFDPPMPLKVWMEPTMSTISAPEVSVFIYQTCT